MFPIQGAPPPADATAPRRRAALGPSSGFGVPSQQAAAAAEAAGGVAAEQALAGMLALQEGAELPDLPHAAARDRQARRRGRDLLDALAALQRAVLGGRAEAAGSLQALAALATAPADAADPALRRLVAEIRLRACVELARYGAV